MKRKRGIVSFDDRERFKPTNILIGLAFTVFLITLGLIVAINFRPLYYLSIDWFDIEKRSGLSATEIELNYNALIGWCSPFCFEKLHFPTLAASASGIGHFEDCKVIFNAAYIAFAVSFFTCGGIIWYKIRKRDFSYLIVSAVTAVTIPAIVGITCLINFDFAFTLMHKIFFTNDDWLFDPATDPIINILPEEFFGLCAGVIILVVVIGATILAVRGILRRRNKEEIWLYNRQTNYYYR